MKKKFLLLVAFIATTIATNAHHSTSSFETSGVNTNSTYLSLVAADNNYHSPNIESANSAIIYYCTDPKAKKYQRSSNCRGLKKYSGSIVK